MQPLSSSHRRQFDFSKYCSRRIALQVAYVGWQFEGFCQTPGLENTVQSALVSALLKCRLIESLDKADYQCCGRTDKSVSGVGQVISVTVRSNLYEGYGVIMPDGFAPLADHGQPVEMDYSTVINRCLPQAVRILAWAPVRRDFSARFNCANRTYRYFFPRGDLDVQAMNEACNYFLGTHDFRNFCKVDSRSTSVTHCTRTVYDARVIVEQATSDQADLCVFQVTANAFLKHQIRSIMAVLLCIGSGLERAAIVDDLLNVQEHPKKPQYQMTVGEPLILRRTQFSTLQWHYNADELKKVRRHFQAAWIRSTLRSRVIGEVLSELDHLLGDGSTRLPVVNALVPSSIVNDKYKPLLSRPSEAYTLEEKLTMINRRKGER